MEHAVRAPASGGTIIEVHASVGDMVSPGTPLVDFEGQT
jgi:biotin carboxyl carrier protein